MFASISSIFSTTSGKSVIFSITVHAAVLGMAGWVVITRPLEKFLLQGKPIAISMQLESEQSQPTSITIQTLAPPAEPVIVSPHAADVQGLIYEQAPSFQVESSLPTTPPQLREVVAEVSEFDDVVDETVETKSKTEEPTETAELEELPTFAEEVAEAQRERQEKEQQRRVRQEEQALGHEETAPNLRRNTPPVYPVEARRYRLEGTVHLEVSISSEGDITHVVVQRSSGHPVLDAAAVNAVRQWRGTPRLRGGVGIESVETLPIVFRLR